MSLCSEGKGGRTALLVCEEEGACQTLCDMLRSHGFVATVARDGREGLGLYSLRGYDLVLAAAKLPKLDGPELVAEIRAASPDQPIILFHSDSMTLETRLIEVSSAHVRALVYPVGAAALREAVASILSTGPARGKRLALSHAIAALTVLCALVFIVWGGGASHHWSPAAVAQGKTSPVENIRFGAPEEDETGVTPSRPEIAEDNVLRGVVLDGTVPVADAAICAYWVADRPHVLEGKTLADGTFRREIPPTACCWITASCGGRFGMARTACPPKGGTPVAITLTASGAISGTVVNEQGAPVANARVVASLCSGNALTPAVLADRRGRFRVPYPWLDEYAHGACGLFVRVLKDGAVGALKLRSSAAYWKPLGESVESAKASVSGVTTETAPSGKPELGGLVVVLGNACSLAGRLTDSSGRPLNQATIVAASMEGTGDTGVEAGADGGFVLDGLVPGHYAISGVPAGEQARKIANVQLAAGERREGLVFAMPSVGHVVCGRVCNAQQQAIADAVVTLVPELPEAGSREARYSARTDRLGRFSIGAVCDGEYSVEVTHAEYVERIEHLAVTRPQETLALELAARPVVEGRVYDEQLDRCPENVCLEVYPGEQPAPNASALCLPDMSLDVDGTFRLVLPAPGTYTLQAGAEMYSFVPMAISLKAGETREGLSLKLKVSSPVYGALLDSRRRPIPNATLVFRRLGIAGAVSATTDKDGHFTATGLDPGKYRVAVSTLDDVPHTTSCEVIANSDLEIVLRPGGTVCGFVRSGERSVDGWTVRLMRGDDWDPEGMTSYATSLTGSAFELPGVPEGHYEIVLGEPRLADQGTGSFAAEVDVIDGQQARVELDVPTCGAALRGTAYVDGVPREGVVVLVSSDRDWTRAAYVASARTNDAGTYCLSGLPSGPVILCATYDPASRNRGDGPYCSKRVSMSLSETSENRQDLELTTESVILVRVDGVGPMETLSVMLLPQGTTWNTLQTRQRSDQYLTSVLGLGRTASGRGLVRLVGAAPGCYSVIAAAATGPVFNAAGWRDVTPKRIVEGTVEMPDTGDATGVVEVRLSLPGDAEGRGTAL